MRKLTRVREFVFLRKLLDSRPFLIAFISDRPLQLGGSRSRRAARRDVVTEQLERLVRQRDVRSEPREHDS